MPSHSPIDILKTLIAYVGTTCTTALISLFYSTRETFLLPTGNLTLNLELYLIEKVLCFSFDHRGQPQVLFMLQDHIELKDSLNGLHEIFMAITTEEHAGLVGIENLSRDGSITIKCP